MRSNKSRNPFDFKPLRLRTLHIHRLYISSKRYIPATLLLDSGVLCAQYLNERTKQCFASLAHVVHKLKEPQVEREFLL